MKAAILFVMACAPLLAQKPAPCTIGGTVTDADNRAPVGQARVIAEIPGKYSLLRLTDAHGKFCFEALPPAMYSVLVQKSGFEPVRHGMTLAVDSDAPVQPLALQIKRFGALAGSVQTPDGHPLPGAIVTVYERAKDLSGRWVPEEVARIETDDFGAFHVDELPAGTYYLSARMEDTIRQRNAFPIADGKGAIPTDREVETFQGGALSFASAAPVKLKAGDRVESLLIAIRKSALRSISGRVANAPRSVRLFYSGVTATSDLGSGAIPIQSSGEFSLSGLMPGRYTINIGDGSRRFGKKEVDVTQSDVAGIVLEPSESFDLAVNLHQEGGGEPFRPKAGTDDLVLLREGVDDGAAIETGPDGDYRLAGLERGVYRLRVNLEGRQLYLKSVKYNGEPQVASRIDLRTGRAGTLDLVFSARVANLQGRVVSGSDSGELKATTTVLLTDELGHIVGQAGTDQKGRFDVGVVAPGKYRLFAIEDFDASQWGPPAMVKTLKSIAVELKENEHKQVVVTAIAARW